MTYDDLRRMTERDEAFILLNVLSPDEFAAEHIPGSVNVHHRLPAFVREVELAIRQVEYARGRVILAIVIYSADDQCTAAMKAAKKLDKAGFTDVSVYREGMEDWRDRAYYVHSGKPRR